MTPATFRLSPARRTLLLIAALFALPFALASALYGFAWRPARLANHGELIEPPQALPENGLSDADGRPLPTVELRGKWTLVLVGQGECAALCREQLQQMRQVQVAQNKAMGRLRRVLLGESVAALAADAALPAIRQGYPDLLIAAPAAGGAGDAWRSALDGAAYRFYLVDPLGNVMMRYPEKAGMSGMRRDLERLLKYSWIG